MFSSLFTGWNFPPSLMKFPLETNNVTQHEKKQKQISQNQLKSITLNSCIGCIFLITVALNLSPNSTRLLIAGLTNGLIPMGVGHGPHVFLEGHTRMSGESCSSEKALQGTLVSPPLSVFPCMP